MRHALSTGALALALTHSVAAQQAECTRFSVRVWSGAFAVRFDTIPGWAIACGPGMRDSLVAVFYRTTPQRAPVTLYVKALSIDSEAERSSDPVAADVSRRRNANNDLTVVARRTLRTAAGDPVEVRQFTGGPHDLVELVGYIRNGPVTALLGMRSFNQAGLDGAARDFERLIQASRPDTVVQHP